MKELELQVPVGTGAMPLFAAIPQEADEAPGVLVYMDAYGPREELRDFARRFASCGYLAVLPQLYHRLGSPVFPPCDRAAGGEQAANDATTLAMSAQDTAAVLAFAQGGGFGLRVGVWGAIGYCMGGRHALGAALRNPQRVRAAVSVHGGRLVAPGEDSVHRQLPRTAVPLHLAFARNDPTCPADHQELLEAQARASGGRITTERHDALHGWSFPDRHCFDRRASERVWERSLALFRQALWTPHRPRLR